MSGDAGERLRRLARGWDEAAAGYEDYYVPRFAPWVAAAVRAVGAGAGRVLPEGPVLVPCCGTFPELAALVERLPGREIVGIDLSPEMVRLAGERAAAHPRVRVVEGDASTLAAHWTGVCAAVVSVFGLQQMPDPSAAMRSWAGALRPGGVLSVVFWPGVTETDGPFALIEELVAAHRPAGAAADRPGDVVAGRPAGDAAWQERLVAVLTAAGLGVECDEPLSYPISHPDASAFFDAHTRAGPLRAFADVRGEAFMAGMRAEFLGRAPAGEWTHRPRARHIVARR